MPRRIVRKITFLTASFLGDKEFLSLYYYGNIGKFLNLSHPKTFCDKLNWLKINSQKEEYSTLVDKIKVKDFVAKLVGAKYIIPTLAIYKSLNDIDITALPNKFVLKCNHDSGGVYVCKEKNPSTSIRLKNLYNLH